MSAVAMSYHKGWIDYTLQNILGQKFWQYKIQNAKTCNEDQSMKSTDLRQTQRFIESWSISTALVLFLFFFYYYYLVHYFHHRYHYLYFLLLYMNLSLLVLLFLLLLLFILWSLLLLLLLLLWILLIMFVIRHDLGENQFLYYSSGIVYPYLSDLIW